MSYGNVYIERDIDSLKEAGYSDEQIVEELSKRIHERYPKLSLPKCRLIVFKLCWKLKTTVEDWTPDL